ncbi:MAG: hypothetical protein WAW53_04010 [Candidatus Dormiibacterota bacterium]
MASVPTAISTPTPVPTAVPSAGPAIGDACVVGTWRVVKDTLRMSFETPQGVVTVAVAGGAGELDRYFSNATVVENLAGTAFTGAARGYRVVARFSGTLRSPVVFANGRETVEPIDSSGARATVSVNGSAPRVYPLASYLSLTYTCSGDALTETDGIGDVYTYRRVSSIP